MTLIDPIIFWQCLATGIIFDLLAIRQLTPVYVKAIIFWWIISAAVIAYSAIQTNDYRAVPMLALAAAGGGRVMARFSNAVFGRERQRRVNNHYLDKYHC